MTSEARIAANRQNAQLSTGPRTAAGKKRSSLNGLTHGLRSEEVVLPTESRDQFDSFLAAWMDDWQPPTETRRFLVERAAVAAWKLRRCMRNEANRQTARALEAAADWDRGGDSRLDEMALRIEDDPEAIAEELLATRAGVGCLIGLWEDLLGALGRPGGWGTDAPHDRFVCLLNLITRPEDPDRSRLRDDSRMLLACSRFGDSSPADGGLTAEEFRPLAAPLVAFCRKSIDRLADCRAGLPEEAPGLGRTATVEMRSLEPRAEDALHHRYEARLDREVRATIGLLMTLRKTDLDLADGDGDGDESESASNPGPIEVHPSEPAPSPKPPAPSEPNAVPGQGLIVKANHDPNRARRAVDGPDDMPMSVGMPLSYR